MAEKMAELNKQYSPQGIVPDITREITLSDPTFGLRPTTSGARVYVTVPETGFYTFTLNNMGVSGGANMAVQVAICDSNDTLLFTVLELRNYLSSGTWGPWATMSQSCFLEKNSRITILALGVASNGFTSKAYKAKAVVLD